MNPRQCISVSTIGRTSRQSLFMPSARPVIAHVLHRLDRAGAEVLAAGLARGLRDDFDFVFLCLDGAGPLAEELLAEGFAVEELGRQPGIDRPLAKRLHDRLDQLGVGLVHAHQYTPFFYSALARGVFARSPAPPILFTEHGRHYPDRRSIKRIAANKLLIKPNDRVTAVGEFVRDALVRNEGIARQRIDVILNGIDPGPEPTPADRTAARQLLGIDTDRPVVIQVARMHPVKDHATALRAWADVHASLPEALLVLVGDGGDRSKIEKLASELNIADVVQFTGAVSNARQLIPAADLCMLTSLSEGISVTLLEAMAAGKPVVATEVGGNPEVVGHDKTGILVPRGAAKRLALILEMLLANAPYTERTFGQDGRKRLLNRFTAKQMHADYAKLYRQSLGLSPD